MRAIICTSIEEFDTLNDHIHNGLIQDVPGYIAESWAYHIVHPEDGRVAICIEDRVSGYLATEECSRVETLPEDWFPEVGG